jgi:hypothetical protein
MGSDLARHAARAVALSLLLATASAWAGEPSAADRETARMYMAEGRAKRDGKDLKSALRAFEAADAIMHVSTTSLEVARTESMLGLLVEARDRALRIARSTPRPGEPHPFVEARAAAQTLAAELESRIPSIRVTIQHPRPGLRLWIDGRRLPSIAIGLGRKLDPGSHVIVVKADGFEKTLTVQVLERESKDVPIDLAPPPPPPAPVASQPASAAPPPEASAETPRRRPPWMTVGVVSLAAGGVGVVLGAVTGAMSLSQTSTIQSQCTAGVCPRTLSDGSDTASAISNARTLATISDVGFIVGGVLAAVGVTFVVLGSSHHTSSMALELGPGSVTLGGTF